VNKLLQLILAFLIMSNTEFASGTTAFNNAIKAVFDDEINYFSFDGSLNSKTITLSRVTRKQTSYNNGEAFPLVIPGSKTVTSSGTNITYTIVLSNTTSGSTNSQFGFGNKNYPVILTLSNISAPVSCRYMFSKCLGLIEADLSKFDTSNVMGENMVSMFQDCSSLKKLDLSNFNTSKVTLMQNMFEGCSSLTELDLSSFNTNNVTNMSSMFGGCSSLTKLDISSFDTGNVTDMSSMFKNARG